MSRPQVEINGCREAHQRLAELVGHLEDSDMRQRSALPGWSVAHVLTHLARNAEAMCRRIEAAIASEVVDQYPGGSNGRDREIDIGAGRSAGTIKADVLDWSTMLDRLFASIEDEVWNRPVRTVAGGQHPVSLLPFRRWREVEVHLVDLGLSFGPEDWSDELVDLALPRLVAGLTDRVDRREAMAWLLGRGPAPELAPWGVGQTEVDDLQ